MALSPATLANHELVGLEAAVVDATDPGRVGRRGRIVDETARTIELATDAGRVTLPKPEVTVRVWVPDGVAIEPPAPGERHAGPSGADAAADRVPVDVDGRRLVGLPTRATVPEGGRSTWH